MSNPPSIWPIGVAAAALGVSAASLAYRYGGDAERYSQFTVGSITWHAAAKTPDYLLLAVLVVVAGGSWGVLRWITEHIDRRFGAHEAERWVATLAFCALPAIAWAGANLFGPMVPLDLLNLASVAIAVAVLATSVLLLSRRTRAAPPTPALRLALTATLLGALFLPMSALAVNRVAMLATRPPIWWGEPSALSLALIGAGAALLTALLLMSRDRDGSARHLLGILQLPYPWAFLIVLPMPWIEGRQITGVFPMHWLPVGALLLVTVAHIDLVRRWVGRHDENVREWITIVSPVCLAAVIITFRLALAPAAHVPADDYHFGEWVLPWWSWSSEGLLPFRDHVPARGMVNYSDGAAAALLGDGTASFIVATAPLVMATLFAGAVAATAAVVGTLAAAAMFVLPPMSDRITDIDLVMTSLLMIGWYAFFRTSGMRWALGWVAALIPAFLFAPGQAVLTAIATAPLLVWQLGRGVLDEPRRVGRTLLWTAAVLAAAMLLTPLGAMLLGAWRYVIEHSAVASVAHGIEWRASVGTQGTANYWLAESIRTSFIVVPIAALALLSAAIAKRDWSRAGSLAVVAVPVLLLGVLYIPRAASRIDPASASRLGVTSAWMHAALMPVLLYAAWGKRRWPAILATAMFVLGALSSMLGGVNLSVFAARAIPSAARPATVVEGQAFGVPKFGFADLQPAHLARVRALRKVLDAVLNPDETYLDLTNRNAHYFYVERRPPIESGAIYNLPNDVQQMRAIRRLEAERVPIVLASADSQLQDGGPPSLREHAIYRYVVQRYAPVAIGTSIFLVRPDRVDRTSQLAGAADASDAQALLDQAFAPPPLEGIPLSWGRSWDALRDAAVLVRTIDIASGGDWPLSTPVAGRDAGLLVLEMACASAAGRVPEIRVSWTGDIPSGMLRLHGGSRLVIPLDASPRWLLARQIAAVHVQSSDDTNCSTSTISRAELWQRQIATITDPN